MATEETNGKVDEVEGDDGEPQPKVAKLDQKPETNAQQAVVDLCRIQIRPLPRFFTPGALKKFLSSKVESLAPHKLLMAKEVGFVSFPDAASAQEAIKLLDGETLKGNVLQARIATPRRDFQQQQRRETNGGGHEVKLKTAREACAELADMPYEQQLQEKLQLSKRVAGNLRRALHTAQTLSADNEAFSFTKVIPAPKTEGYRNKCEFSIGYDAENRLTVGFMAGRFREAASRPVIAPLKDVPQISRHMERVVQKFQHFLETSPFPPFDEKLRDNGLWRLLTIREMGADCMVSVVVSNLESEALEQEKTRLRETLMAQNLFEEESIRVTSLYWQMQQNLSDRPEMQLLDGAPYIYEQLGRLRFRVSPAAFFQTNTAAASVLFKSITEIAVQVEQPTDEKKPLMLLDICCGTGTIGLSMLSRCAEICPDRKSYLIGVEICAEAVEDAKLNAAANGFHSDRLSFVALPAEEAFDKLKSFKPTGCQDAIENCTVVGVLDPPRAGLPDKLIRSVRKLSTMKRLIYVSCDPAAAQKNHVDLCRFTSNKFEGEPFRLKQVQPVDMFPQTKHVEWVMLFER